MNELDELKAELVANAEQQKQKHESIYERNERLGVERKIADFKIKQKLPYEQKVQYAKIRAREFVKMCDEHDMNYHVSVGGLDSITLYVFLKSIGIDAHPISCSYLEDKSNQAVHKALGIECISPVKDKDGKPYSKNRIIKEYGFPVLSKEIANKIENLQDGTEKNKTVRHAIITGETGEFGGNRTGSRMQLSKVWLNKFGGWDKEGQERGYTHPNFKVSSKCCYYLKEKPCEDWAKANNSVPFLGIMASEGGRREKALMANGCNYWSEGTKRSAPFAIFMRDDILRLALDMDKYYQNHWREFGTEKIDSIIPEIYGRIEKDADGHYETTGAKRTGCSMCGFGIHLEKRPNRFDLLYNRNRKEWEYLMFHVGKDTDGNEIGWAKVLEYIGIDYHPVPMCEQIRMEL